MSTYRAAVCTQLGKPLEIVDRPLPTNIGKDEVDISTYASVVNYADIERCRGQREDVPELPYVPGAVAAGKVTRMGADVTNVKVGDRVVALNYGSLGGMAEHITVTSKRVFPVPDSVTLSKAAAATVAYSAAISALNDKARVEKGNVVLVTGASGATGLAIADAAKNMYGCQVITLCRGQRKRDFLLERGFDHVIDTTDLDPVEAAMDITEGRGVHVAVDVVGGQLLGTCLNSLCTDGILVIVGFSSGEIPAIPADILKKRSLTVMGLNWKTVEQTPILLQAAGAGTIDPYVCKEFPLDHINEAYQMVWERKSVGKVVVQMRSEDQ